MATLIDIAERRTEREAGHPSAETLQTFAAGRLEAERLLAVSSHLLTDCSRCRRILRDSFGVQPTATAPFRSTAPPDLVDRLRTIAELSPAQLRLALTNLTEATVTTRAAATLEAQGQIEEPDVQTRLLVAGAELLLDELEAPKPGSNTQGAADVGLDEALLLGRLAFELRSTASNHPSLSSATEVIERAWRAVEKTSFDLPRALLLSAYALLERSLPSSATPRWSRPPANAPFDALLRAQRLFALAPSTVEHAISTYALAGIALESKSAASTELLGELSRTLEQQAQRLVECGERRMARVATEFRLAVDIRTEDWRSALRLAESLMRSYEDEGDVPSALRVQTESARVHAALGDTGDAITTLRSVKNGFLINGYALDSAFAALELAEMELDSGMSSCASLESDLLPVFAAIEDREVVAVLLMVRDAAMDGSLNTSQLAECRALLFELTSD